MSDVSTLSWFGARTYFTIKSGGLSGKIEEVVFVLRAISLDDALERGWRIADKYSRENNYELSEYLQVYEMCDDSPFDGAEVFSYIHRNFKGSLEDLIKIYQS
jgi:hypothetical protein